MRHNLAGDIRSIKMKSLLSVIEHRAYPYPRAPWVMTQTWDDLLFAHWPFEPDSVRPLVPPEMELDTFDGAAWVGVVPFKMSKVRPRFTPLVPVLSDFLELNVRTYVTVDGISGVYFFSLDASSLFAVEGARQLYHLPYYFAEMRVHEREGCFHYRSLRLDKRADAGELTVSYAPNGAAFKSSSGSLEHFLTERYCLYTMSPDRFLLRAHIHHEPWSLQKAGALFQNNTMLLALGLKSEVEPILQFSKSLLTVEWAPEVVR